MKKKDISREFSKRITVRSLYVFFIIAIYGIYTKNEHTADILNALGPWVLGFLFTYMGIGYGDYRVSKGLPSFTDILSILVTKNSPASKEKGDGE